MTAFTWFWLYTAQSMKGTLLCACLPHNFNNRITLTNSAHVGDGKGMLRKDKHEVTSTCVISSAWCCWAALGYIESSDVGPLGC